MANICSTELLIKSSKLNEEKKDKIVEYIKENYAYMGEVDDINYQEDEENYFEVFCSTKWNVIPEILQKIAKDFEVDIRAIGREDGVGFIQVVSIDEKGEIYQNDEIEL